MRALLAFSRSVDRFAQLIGRSVRWLVLVIVIISVVSAIILKLFNIGSNASGELQWQLFGAMFMLASAYVLLENGHVRIDVISSRLSKRSRDIIDLFGHLFVLLPFSVLMVWLSWPFFWESFFSQEVSVNDGGLLIWPAKLVILLGAVMLSFQALSEAIKRAAVLSGDIKDPEVEAVHGHNPQDFEP